MGKIHTTDSHVEWTYGTPPYLPRKIANITQLETHDRQVGSTEDQLERCDITDEASKRIHLHLGQCVETTLGNMTNASH